MRILLAALIWGLGAMVAVGQERPAVIAVEGEGRVSAAPDTAWIDIGVVVQAPQAQDATEALSQAMEAVLTTLREADIPQADIRTGQLALGPAPREDGGQGSAGYRAESDVEVRIAELDRLGEIVGAAVESGATTLRGLRFGLADPEATEDAALRAAVEDALRKARLVAEAAGVSPGAILRIEESGGGGGPIPMMRSDVGGGSVPVAPGQIETTATVALDMAIAE